MVAQWNLGSDSRGIENGGSLGRMRAVFTNRFALALSDLAASISSMNHSWSRPALQSVVLSCVFSLLWSVSAQEAKPPKTLTELQQELAAHISQPKFDAALWGVKIVSL